MAAPPTLPPPRLRPKNPKSADSFPGVTPDESKRLWQVLERLERRLDEGDRDRGRDMVRHVELEEQVHEQSLELREVKKMLHGANELAKATNNLSNEVRGLLNRDAEQEKRLGQIELRAVQAGVDAGGAAGVEAGSKAGGKAGGKWAGIMTLVGILLGSTISTGITQCQAAEARASHHPGQ